MPLQTLQGICSKHWISLRIILKYNSHFAWSISSNEWFIQFTKISLDSTINLSVFLNICKSIKIKIKQKFENIKK